MTTLTKSRMPESVRSFWQGVNWDDRPVQPGTPQVSTAQLHEEAEVVGEQSLALTLSVKQYFSAIPWSGIAIVAAAPATLPPSTDTEEDSETLDDFLSDVSDFF